MTTTSTGRAGDTAAQVPEGLRKTIVQALRVETRRDIRDGFGESYLTRLSDAVLDAVVSHLERPDSPLCDCPRLENPPVNPDTRARMDHHCDCRAVETVAIVLGTYSKTAHGRQCVHGTEMDLYYAPPVSSTGEETGTDGR